MTEANEGRESLSGKKSGESSRKSSTSSRSSKSRSSRTSKNWRNLESVKTLASRLGHNSASLTSVAGSATSSSHERLPLVMSNSVPGAITASGAGASSVRDPGLIIVHKNLKKAHTVGAQFQHSLQSLMVALNTANPYFVRCVKSNRLKV